MIYPITPVPKPRMTRADKWKVRDCVAKYRAFADECRLRGVKVHPGDSVLFLMPMPRSWSKRKRAAMNGQPHTQKPDIDNLHKALLDAVHKDDAHIWKQTVEKRWAEEGAIVIWRVGGNEP